MNIHFPFQESTLFNRNALRGHVARHHRRLPQLHAIRSVYAAIQLTENHQYFGANVGLDLSIRTDRKAVVAQLNLSFDIAIHIQVLGARQLSLNDHGLADVGAVSGLRNIHAVASIFSRSVRRD